MMKLKIFLQRTRHFFAPVHLHFFLGAGKVTDALHLLCLALLLTAIVANRSDNTAVVKYQDWIEAHSRC